MHEVTRTADGEDRTMETVEVPQPQMSRRKRIGLSALIASAWVALLVAGVLRDEKAWVFLTGLSALPTICAVAMINFPVEPDPIYTVAATDTEP